MACAEVRVSGHGDNLTIEARDATLDEVLRALRTSFKFQFRGDGLNQPVSGTYSGSLMTIVARLLAGRDYVLHRSATHLEAVILGGTATASARPVAAARANAAPAKECQYKDGDRIIPVEC